MEKQTIFITGGCGYVGYPTACALLQKGYRVVLFDHTISSEKTCDAHPFLTIIRGDICDYDTLFSAMKASKPSYVIHLAAKILVSESEHQKALYKKVNVIGTRYVLRAMKQSGCTKLLFASSAAVYEMCTTPVKEGQRLQPCSYYGQTKKEAETIIQKTKGIQFVILRYFNIVGNESVEGNPKLITSAIRVAKGLQKKLMLYGHDYRTPDGTAIRDYVHIDDIVAANCASVFYLEKNKKKSILCNIGSGVGISNRRVITEIERFYHVTIPIVYRKKRKEAPFSVADITHARLLLAWRPRVSRFAAIIQSYSTSFLH